MPTAPPSSASQGTWVRRYLIAALPLSGLALGLLMYLYIPRSPATPPSPIAAPQGALASGDLAVRISARRGQQTFPVLDRARLRPGDALQVAIGPTGRSQLAVLSVGAGGRSQVHLPPNGQASLTVDPSAALVLASEIVLQGPGPTRLFVVASHEPLDLALVRSKLDAIASQGAGAIRTTGAIPLPGTTQTSRLFEQER